MTTQEDQHYARAGSTAHASKDRPQQELSPLGALERAMSASGKRQFKENVNFSREDDAAMTTMADPYGGGRSRRRSERGSRGSGKAAEAAADAAARVSPYGAVSRSDGARRADPQTDRATDQERQSRQVQENPYGSDRRQHRPYGRAGHRRDCRQREAQQRRADAGRGRSAFGRDQAEFYADRMQREDTPYAGSHAAARHERDGGARRDRSDRSFDRRSDLRQATGRDDGQVYGRPRRRGDPAVMSERAAAQRERRGARAADDAEILRRFKALMSGEGSECNRSVTSTGQGCVSSDTFAKAAADPLLDDGGSRRGASAKSSSEVKVVIRRRRQYASPDPESRVATEIVTVPGHAGTGSDRDEE